MILVTGCAGFIGYHLSQRLLNDGQDVIGIDNLNTYYSVQLKSSRIKNLKEYSNFKFIQADINDDKYHKKIISFYKPETVIHLAAQPGVRYSLENPFAYVDSNVEGTVSILELCSKLGVKHLIAASSSSVYGMNVETPFSTEHTTDHPVSIYAATKKASEMLAHSYSYINNIPVTMLRFFTVYGPWGRPDMAYFSFTKKILDGETIDVYNNGEMYRDFTYVDDVVESIVKIIPLPPEPHGIKMSYNLKSSMSYAPYHVYNIGGNKPVALMDFISTLEEVIGKTTEKRMLPMQPGDVEKTCSDTEFLERLIGYKPETELRVGLERFFEWYKEYYKI